MSNTLIDHHEDQLPITDDMMAEAVRTHQELTAQLPPEGLDRVTSRVEDVLEVVGDKTIELVGKPGATAIVSATIAVGGITAHSHDTGHSTQPVAIEHVVKKGETITKIAKESGSSTSAILQDPKNTSLPTNPDKILNPGTLVDVPESGLNTAINPVDALGNTTTTNPDTSQEKTTPTTTLTTTPPATSSPTTIAPSAPVKAPTSLIVQPGDTLGALANRAGLTLPELVRDNPTIDPNLIHPGETISTTPPLPGQTPPAGEVVTSPETADKLPPTVENYVISILKALAVAQNIPESQTVTQAHINALMSWAYLEEGDLGNNGHFNVFNTGIDNPALLATANRADGVQAFISFNAGVEGTVQTMLGSNQNRFAITLSDPSLSEEQLFEKWTYYQNFPGNKIWAAADSNATIDGVVYTQAGYLESLQSRFQQVMSDYGAHASVLLGRGYSGYLDNPLRVSESFLQFTGKGPVAPPVVQETTTTIADSHIKSRPNGKISEPTRVPRHKNTLKS